MINDPQTDQPTIDDVLEAADRLAGFAVHTPLMRSDAIDAMVGTHVWFKPECLQRTGSFKIRGAWNRISRLSEAQRRDGVIAYSSGNHAQGVAASAQRLNIPATIVMPADAPRSKIEATRRLGADVRLYDRASESREEIGGQIARATGATLVRPFDDAYVIAGQGTATLEAVVDALAEGVNFASMVCPASGGGLLAGAATVLPVRSPDCRLFVAEPESHDDHIRSLVSGNVIANEPGFRSIADALLAPQPGDLTYPINRRFVVGGVAVSDVDILSAMKIAFDHLKLVVEPGGAVSLAALLKEPLKLTTGGPVLILLSGGNVDPDIFASALEVTHRA